MFFLKNNNPKDSSDNNGNDNNNTNDNNNDECQPLGGVRKGILNTLTEFKQGYIQAND